MRACCRCHAVVNSTYVRNSDTLPAAAQLQTCYTTSWAAATSHLTDKKRYMYSTTHRAEYRIRMVYMAMSTRPLHLCLRIDVVLCLIVS